MKINFNVFLFCLSVRPSVLLDLRRKSDSICCVGGVVTCLSYRLNLPTLLQYVPFYKRIKYYLIKSDRWPGLSNKAIAPIKHRHLTDGRVSPAIGRQPLVACLYANVCKYANQAHTCDTHTHVRSIVCVCVIIHVSTSG